MTSPARHQRQPWQPQHPWRTSLIAGLLLMACALPAAPQGGGGSSYEAYRQAIEFDKVGNLQPLVRKGLGPNLVMPDATPALIYAMQKESRQVVEWLLTQPGLQVDQQDGRGDTALMLACAMGEQAWVEKLIQRGASVNPAGWTPLHYAAANSRLSIIELLLRKKADINAKSPNGTTPLMMAARANATDAVRLLLGQGAQTTPVNEAGMNALAYARKNQNQELTDLLSLGR